MLSRRHRRRVKSESGHRDCSQRRAGGDKPHPYIKRPGGTAPSASVIPRPDAPHPVTLSPRYVGEGSPALYPQPHEILRPYRIGTQNDRWDSVIATARQPHEILRPDWIGTQNNRWYSVIATARQTREILRPYRIGTQNDRWETVIATARHSRVEESRVDAPITHEPEPWRST